MTGVVAVVGLSSIRSWDIWWHLETGQLALSRFSTLPVDEFSLTRAGEPWLYKDLGADVLLYGVYAIAGPLGLALVKLAVAAAVFALLMAVVARRSRSTWLTLLVAGVAFLIAAFRIIVRPEAFTLVLLLLTVLLIDRWRAPPVGDTKSDGATASFRSTLLALATVHLLWTNLHRGVVLGLALLWTQVLYELLVFAEVRLRGGAEPRLFRVAGGDAAGRASRLRSAALFAGAATLVSALNPFGIRPLLMAFDVTASETVSRLVSEWQALGLAEHWQHFPLATVWMVVAALSVLSASFVALRRGGRPTFWDLGVTVLFIAIGLSAVRMLPLMVIGTAGPAASSLAKLLRVPRQNTARQAGVLTATVGLVVCLLAWSDPRIEPSRPGFADNWYPESAVTLLLSGLREGEGPIQGEGFTTFTYAGYVIFHAWPDKHVICDGRFDTVYDDDTMEQCLRADRNEAIWQRLQQAHDLEWVLTHNRPPLAGRADGPGSFHFLDRDPEWALVFWDSTALLYVRALGPNQNLANEMSFAMLRPHDPDVSLFEALQRTADNAPGRARLDREIRRLQAAAPTDYRTHILLALYLFEIGESGSNELDVLVDALRLNRDRNPAAIDQVLEWIGESNE